MNKISNGDQHKKDFKNGPPEAEDEPSPRLIFSFWEIFGLILIGIFPILACFGFLGDKTADLSKEGSRARLSVHYPSIMRYSDTNKLDITVQNISGEELNASVFFE